MMGEEKYNPRASMDREDTVLLVLGITGRTMCLAGYSNRVKLIAYREEPGEERWCRMCSSPF